MGAKIISVIKKIEQYILAFALMIILLMCMLQVIGRYTELPFSGAFEEVAVNLFIWVTMLGAGVCVRDHSHMRMDILDSFLPEKAMPYVSILRELIIAVAFGTVAVITMDYIPVVKRTGLLTASLFIPQYILYLAMPIGFSLMVFWSVLNIAEIVKKLKKTNSEV